MPALRYRDTRGFDPSRPSFTDVVVKGIARGGGLFVPEKLPTLGAGRLEAWAGLPYHERAAEIFRLFEVDIPEERLGPLMRLAFGQNFDHPRVAPVVAVGPFHVLELWHGPTSAFKDMALQCMPLCFSEAVRLQRGAGGALPDYLVLVATSGDTGKAALEGFADRESTGIVVFYPAEGVSDIQRLQMVTQRGSNVGVFGVRGNFDDCQTAVKLAFNDRLFNEELRSAHNLELSSANSINWGRLLPQIVYYASAYADLLAEGALEAGQPLDVCVPTGNFGNILAGFYAKRIGVPLGRLLCASNQNNVLADFLASGIYDVAGRPFYTTPSPSMDILISSNLERALFELSGDAERVRDWMKDLAENGRFQMDGDIQETLASEFHGGYVGNDESLEVISEVWQSNGYLLDPHTAVAWRVGETLAEDRPLLVVSTAHWAKFGADVFRALQGIPYGGPLPAEAASLSGLELLERVSDLAPGQEIPPSLGELASLPERFSAVVEGSREGVEGAVRGWLRERL